MSANVIEVKQKIIRYISEMGPSLPAHLTKVSELNLTFTSAILSELLAEKKLKLSNLRVGASPLYLVPGQEERLEGFISNLKEPEIEAFKKLKQNKILDDEKQDPVMRVALRFIRDFAIPLKNREKLYWKYYLLPDDKASMAISERDEPVQAVGQERIIGQQIWEDIQKQQVSKEKIAEIVKKQVEEISKKMKEEQEVKKIGENEAVKTEETKEPMFNNIGLIKKSEEVNKRGVTKKLKKTSQKDLFLEETKNCLVSRGFEIEEVLKNDAIKIVLKVRKEEEILAIVSGKKKMDEKEILKDLRKYNSLNLKVEFFFRGELTKKVTEKIDLFAKVRKINKI